MRSTKTINAKVKSLDCQRIELRNEQLKKECDELSFTLDISEKQNELLEIILQLKKLKEDCLKALNDNELRSSDKKAYINNVKTLIDSITEMKAALSDKIENDYSVLYQRHLYHTQGSDANSARSHTNILNGEAHTAEFLAHEKIVKFCLGVARLNASRATPVIAACSPLNTTQKAKPAQIIDKTLDSSNKASLGLRRN